MHPTRACAHGHACMRGLRQTGGDMGAGGGSGVKKAQGALSGPNTPGKAGATIPGSRHCLKGLRGRKP